MSRDAPMGAVLGASVLAAATLRSGSHAPALASAVIAGLALGALVTYDLRERRIPNRIVVSATAACAGIDGFFRIAPGAIVTATVVSVALLGVALSRPTAIGMGDAKLALLISAAFPAHAAPALVLGLGLAAIAGILIACIRGEHVRGAREMRVPLAPFLAAATVLALL
jgi:leader peptidase (prepilin peptidase) / N-methyltransferase